MPLEYLLSSSNTDINELVNVIITGIANAIAKSDAMAKIIKYCRYLIFLTISISLHLTLPKKC